MTRVRNTKPFPQGKIFKEEHKKIYDAFFHVLKNKEQESKEKQSKSNKKEVFTFLLDNLDNIFNNVYTKVRPLSEENFCQLLLSLFKEINVQDLSNDNSDNSIIKQIVTKCIDDARSAEAWDWIINYAKYKIPAREWLEKIPGLEKVFSVKEEKEVPKSDTEMVNNVLFKVFTPVAIFAVTALFFGMSPIMIVFAVIGIIVTTYKTVNSLFSNIKEDTIYNPDSQQEQKQDWKKNFYQGIDNILDTTANEIEKPPTTLINREIIIGNNAEHQRA